MSFYRFFAAPDPKLPSVTRAVQTSWSRGRGNTAKDFEPIGSLARPIHSIGRAPAITAKVESECGAVAVD
jgi:hypothetical protein